MPAGGQAPLTAGPARSRWLTSFEGAWAIDRRSIMSEDTVSTVAAPVYTLGSSPAERERLGRQADDLLPASPMRLSGPRSAPAWMTFVPF